MTHETFGAIIVWIIIVLASCGLAFLIIRTAIVSAIRSGAAGPIVTCRFCSTTIGVPAPGWSLTHHADGSHTAFPPIPGTNPG